MRTPDHMKFARRAAVLLATSGRVRRVLLIDYTKNGTLMRPDAVLGVVVEDDTPERTDYKYLNTYLIDSPVRCDIHAFHSEELVNGNGLRGYRGDMLRKTKSGELVYDRHESLFTRMKWWFGCY